MFERRREIAKENHFMPDCETLSRKAAQLIGAQVLYKPDTFRLATGSSRLALTGIWLGGMLPAIWILPRPGSVNLDEYCGLDAFHEQSYHYFMENKTCSTL